jgi:hypothetical protein
MLLINVIRDAWGWCGLEPAVVEAINAFGNVIVRAKDGSFWRICPEELSCQKVATDAFAFEAMRATPDFQLDWAMQRLVDEAIDVLGSPGPDRCFGMVKPAVIGGPYTAGNCFIVPLQELITCSGYMAHQIKDLPDGTVIEIVVDRD